MKKLIVVLLASISMSASAQVISGKVERVNGDTVMVMGYRFVIPGHGIKYPLLCVGDSASFTGTNNSYRKTRRKISSKMITDSVTVKN